ncbi:MAG: tryptophan synthase subunit alpha [Cyanobacteria bacterium SZAS LIN-2]|nr:tryptophan synthase subunit alpha [Cyanobacteria bacterium SZAS LIN-2]
MSNRYKKRFEELKQNNLKAFMPFTVLGWPDPKTSFDMIKQMIEAGASALELGFAFSDPVADGPSIQRADFETLAYGFTVAQGLDLIKDVRNYDGEIPIGVLIYYNLILAHGPEAFFKDAAAAGIDGVLIADLPVDSSGEVEELAAANGIDLIFLISPVTSPERMDLITKKAAGFIYLLSRLGVTGTHERSQDGDRALAKTVAAIKERTSLPVMAGFGISNATNAGAMYKIGCDGVITGSKIIELASRADAETKLQEFYKSILAAV